MTQHHNILIYDESRDVLHALEHYVQTVPAMSAYQLVGCCKYGEITVASQYQAADIILFGLFRRYGTRIRAEGVPVLAGRINRGRMGLVVGFGIPEIADNPLVWDVLSDRSLAEKLSNLTALDDPRQSLQELMDHFQNSIFPVDGHE